MMCLVPHDTRRSTVSCKTYCDTEKKGSAVRSYTNGLAHPVPELVLNFDQETSRPGRGALVYVQRVLR